MKGSLVWKSGDQSSSPFPYAVDGSSSLSVPGFPIFKNLGLMMHCGI